MLKAALYSLKAFPAFYIATPIIVAISAYSITNEGPTFENELSLKLLITIFRDNEAILER